MKSKDLLTIVVVVIVSAAISLFVSSKVFSTPAQRQQQVEVIPQISSDFPTPDSKYFNPQSIDPTQTIQIGPNNNTNPFNSTQ